MRETRIIILILLILIIGCKSRSGIEYPAQDRFGFDYLETDSIFELELVMFQKNTAYCGTKGLPYALLIGKTKSDLVPEFITVLSYCDNRIFNIGDKLRIEPTENPTKKTSLNPIYFVKDTIINGNKHRWIIGSEYKAIWGRPALINE
jgi:hypothetical protein